MLTTHLAASSDLPAWTTFAAIALAVVSLAILVFEMRRRERGGAIIALTGIGAALLLLCAVLRPVRIAARESVVGARVIVLADSSRSMALASDGSGTRREARDRALAELTRTAKNERLLVLGFGDGPALPMPAGDANGANADATTRLPRSDLGAAIRAIAASPEERPAAIVVVSDGRLDDPGEDATRESLAAIEAGLKVPIHTVATTKDAPADASVRRVAAAGAAVAHVPIPLRVEIGCSGGLACNELTVTARELRDGEPPALLASGLAHLKDGLGVVDLTVTLERAGTRILEVAITPPSGDTIPENDRRFVAFNVARDHVRVLHVAGEPTNDVRALRQWLKSDGSVDVVAFFILRTNESHTQAANDDLALIPFPVDELFSEQLPSFDAVILQDFDAQPYGLARHLPAIASYVKSGGGLIMVGGPKSFVAGGYAGTPLASVLPISLDGTPGVEGADLGGFVPEWTEQGRAAPMLGPLRAVVGDELPTMPGTSVLGDVRGQGVVLWSHPSRKTKSGAAMPVLALGDEGDGRSIALGVDGGWLLEFSALGARTAGRGHGALWDGLLGWLMRDPRFEPAQMEIVGGCTAGLASKLRVQLLPLAHGVKSEKLAIDIARIDAVSADPRALLKHIELARTEEDGAHVEVTLPPLGPGGYTARLRVGNAPATRRDFACEAGGDEWADSRPDPDRMRAIANATGGTFAWASDDLARLPLPKPTVVSAERHVVPLAPPWVWTLAAVIALGAHWFARRRSGLT